MAKMGRPKKEFNKEEFEKLCGLQCTELEICEWFDTTDKTLTRWCIETYGKSFSEVFAQKRTIGLVSLRRHSFQMAQHNPAMNIFLCKNYLGMSDKIEQTVNVIDDATRQEVNKLISDVTNKEEDS